jgi:transcriptional regulator of acetoin/glycerol metabolism
MSALSAYQWPGNIRELQNLIERAVILSNDGVLPNPLPTVVSQGVSSPPAVTTLRDSERALILNTLEAAGWVIGGAKGAAARLGLKRTTLICKMQKLGIFRPSFPSSQDGNWPPPHELAALPHALESKTDEPKDVRMAALNN